MSSANWFADYGTSGWDSDLPKADSQARAWIETTATARGWSAAWKAAGLGHVDAALEAADGWLSDDVGLFWQTLCDLFDGATGAPAGWPELRNTFASASGTVAQRELASTAAVVQEQAQEAVEKAAEAVEESATWWGSNGRYVLIGLAALGLVVILWLASRRL